MVFNFFKTKRSAHIKKKDGETTAEAGPPTPSDRPSLFPNSLALNPPNRLHWIPQPRGQDETARIVSGDLSATADLSHLINCADRLTKIAPELNMGGLGATQRLLKTGGADASELIADQARAKKQLAARRNRGTRMLPAVFIQVSNNGNTTSYSPVVAGCNACKACFEKCPTCYHTAEKTPSPPPCRNPSSDQLARLDKRPVPLGYDLASPASICSSLIEILPEDAINLMSDEDENKDEGGLCQVTQLGVIYKGAKVVDIGSVRGECYSPSIFPHVRPLTIVRHAVPSDKPTLYLPPSAALSRPDSPTLPAEVPAALFSKRK